MIPKESKLLTSQGWLSYSQLEDNTRLLVYRGGKIAEARLIGINERKYSGSILWARIQGTQSGILCTADQLVLIDGQPQPLNKLGTGQWTTLPEDFGDSYRLSKQDILATFITCLGYRYNTDTYLLINKSKASYLRSLIDKELREENSLGNKVIFKTKLYSEINYYKSSSRQYKELLSIFNELLNGILPQGTEIEEQLQTIAMLSGYHFCLNGNRRYELKQGVDCSQVDSIVLPYDGLVYEPIVRSGYPIIKNNKDIIISGGN